MLFLISIKNIDPLPCKCNILSHLNKHIFGDFYVILFPFVGICEHLWDVQNEIHDSSEGMHSQEGGCN